MRTASTKLKGELIADPDIKDVPGIVKRQSKFAVVSHDNVRRVRTNRPTNSPGLTYSSPLAQTTSETVQINIQPDESIGSASKCFYNYRHLAIIVFISQLEM